MNAAKRKISMPVRYLINTVLVALLFLGLSFLTRNALSTYQNKVLLLVGINMPSSPSTAPCPRACRASPSRRALRWAR